MKNGGPGASGLMVVNICNVESYTRGDKRISLIRGGHYNNGPSIGLLAFAIDNVASGTYVAPRITNQ